MCGHVDEQPSSATRHWFPGSSLGARSAIRARRRLFDRWPELGFGQESDALVGRELREGMKQPHALEGDESLKGVGPMGPGFVLEQRRDRNCQGGRDLEEGNGRDPVVGVLVSLDLIVFRSNFAANSAWVSPRVDEPFEGGLRWRG